AGARLGPGDVGVAVPLLRDARLARPGLPGGGDGRVPGARRVLVHGRTGLRPGRRLAARFEAVRRVVAAGEADTTRGRVDRCAVPSARRGASGGVGPGPVRRRPGSEQTGEVPRWRVILFGSDAGGCGRTASGCRSSRVGRPATSRATTTRPPTAATPAATSPTTNRSARQGRRLSSGSAGPGAKPRLGCVRSRGG